MGFVMEFGRREPGFLNWIKYEECCGYARARPWLFFWRMFWSTHELSRHIDDPMTRWQCLRYAAQQTRQMYAKR